MNMQKLTQKSIEAIRDARAAALEYGNPQIEEAHLLFALLSQDGGLIPELIKKLRKSPDEMKKRAESIISSLPKVSGGGEAYVSRELEISLNAAESRAEMMRDEYISVEHLALGLIDKGSGAIKKLFEDFGVTVESFLEVLASVRGSARVTTDDPESTYDALKKYGSDLTELA